jgi:hypothetical protein
MWCSVSNDSDVQNSREVRNSEPPQKADIEYVDQISCDTVDKSKRKSQKEIK